MSDQLRTCYAVQEAEAAEKTEPVVVAAVLIVAFVADSVALKLRSQRAVLFCPEVRKDRRTKDWQ